MPHGAEVRALHRAAMIALLLVTASCGGAGGGGGGGPTSPVPVPTPSPTPAPTSSIIHLMKASDWEIGPIIDGKNYSKNVPLHPIQSSDGTWYIDLPQSDGVHYVTTSYPSLTGYSKITIDYRIEMAAGVKIVPSTDPAGPSIGPTLYFERAGDDWNTDGYRWWATFAAVIPMVAGENEVSASLDSNWTSVMTKTAFNYPSDFSLSKQTTQTVGFTLGGGTGYGHGVYATGAARLVVKDFRLEP